MDLQMIPEDDAMMTTSLPSFDQNPAAIYLIRLDSEHSRRVIAGDLRTLAALLTGQDVKQARDMDIFALNWGALRYPHTMALRARLLELYRPASVNRILSALRGVLREAWRLGVLDAEEYHRAVDLPNVKSETLPSGRALTQGEIFALVNTCKADSSPAGVRDAAILGLLYTCGLRRAEIVALDSEDFDMGSTRLVVRGGKGGKQRAVYVQGGALRAMLDWLALLPMTAEPLFVPILKSGRLTPRRMSAQSIYDLVKKRADSAGVADFSPHDFRRTFVGDMLERGVDLATVASIAGHASVETTRRYDRRPDETKRKAAEKLHFPY